MNRQEDTDRKGFVERIELHDRRAFQQFAALEKKIDHFFLNVETDCPYGMPYRAVFHQAFFAPVDEHIMELFLAVGYRRNGNCLYTMRCPECSACLSIRMIPELFTPNRSQKRNWKQNDDLVDSFESVEGREENIALCSKFLDARYPGDNSGARYYKDFFENSIVSSAELQFRKNGRLVGSSIIDFGRNWLNAVYFFFDPEESRRGLGTYNILTLIDICRERGLEYLYLGYYIKEVRSMNYKVRFKPYQLLLDEQWQFFT